MGNIKETYAVNKNCKISYIDDWENNLFLLDIIATEEMDKGFINFQFSVGTMKSCCESNKLNYKSLEYSNLTWEEEPTVEDRITSGWLQGFEDAPKTYFTVTKVKELIVTKVNCSNEYDTGERVKIKIILSEDTVLTISYENVHNGSYAHSVYLEKNNDVIYSGWI